MAQIQMFKRLEISFFRLAHKGVSQGHQISILNANVVTQIESLYHLAHFRVS